MLIVPFSDAALSGGAEGNNGIGSGGATLRADTVFDGGAGGNGIGGAGSALGAVIGGAGSAGIDGAGVDANAWAVDIVPLR